MTTNLFNFADLTDIAETNPDLANKVANSSQDSIDQVVGIFTAAAEAGVEAMSIAQVQVVAIRMGIELPSEATIRKYINTAIEQGSLAKPTRQTYSAVSENVTVAPVEGDLGDDLPE